VRWVRELNSGSGELVSSATCCPSLLFNQSRKENKVQRAHHACHKVGMRYIPRPYSGPGKQSWTRACVGGGGPDWKREKKIREKKRGERGDVH